MREEEGQGKLAGEQAANEGGRKLRKEMNEPNRMVPLMVDPALVSSRWERKD